MRDPYLTCNRVKIKSTKLHFLAQVLINKPAEAAAMFPSFYQYQKKKQRKPLMSLIGRVYLFVENKKDVNNQGYLLFLEVLREQKKQERELKRI